MTKAQKTLEAKKEFYADKIEGTNKRILELVQELENLATWKQELEAAQAKLSK